MVTTNFFCILKSEKEASEILVFSLGGGGKGGGEGRSSLSAPLELLNLQHISYPYTADIKAPHFARMVYQYTSGVLN